MKIAILISGSGSTAQAVIQATQNGVLYGLIDPVLVIASNSKASGIQKVLQRGIPVEIISREQISKEVLADRLLQLFSTYEVEMVSQNGWLPLTPSAVITKFYHRIINQHPGPLDPGYADFGGRGMYGARVLCARIIYCMLTKEKNPWTEATTHFVTEEYDKGEIIRTIQMPFSITQPVKGSHEIKQSHVLQVYIRQQTEILQKQLLSIEHTNVINTLKDFAEKTIVVHKRPERLIPTEYLPFLAEAKDLAIQLFPTG
jgi:phosphoribosylglycinamide formyltransferase-1